MTGVEYEIATAPAVDLPALRQENAADLGTTAALAAVPGNLFQDDGHNALCDAEEAVEVGVPEKCR